MGDVFYRCCNLPIRVRAVTVIDSDGDYNVYVNADLCEAKRKKTLQHELNHIRLNHFYEDKPVLIAELEAKIK